MFIQEFLSNLTDRKRLILRKELQMLYRPFTRCYMCFSPWTTIWRKKQKNKLIEMTNVSLQSFSFSFSLQVMKAPALTSNNSVWELTSKTTINCNPVKSPLSQLLISRVLLPALALWMGLVKCYWRWMGSGCCGSRVLKVALMHPSLPRPPSSSSIPNTLLILHLWCLKGNITATETFRFFTWSNAFYP